MKKILLTAVLVLLLASLCVTGMMPAKTSDGSVAGIVNAATLEVAALNAQKPTELEIPTITRDAVGYSDSLIEQAPAGATAIADGNEFASKIGSNPSGTFVLSADITVNATVNENFSGKLYGAGHTITTTHQLFTKVSGKALIRDLQVLATEEISGNAVFAATSDGVTMINVKADAIVEGNTLAGGFIGEIKTGDAKFSHCEMNGSVAAKNGLCGGFAATFVATTPIMEYCVNRADVYAALAGAGGFFAKVSSNIAIENCENYGNVSTAGASGSDVAGFIGLINAEMFEMTKCYNAGDVTGVMDGGGSDAAGIIGEATKSPAIFTFTDCVNDGTIKGTRTAGILGCTYYASEVVIQGCINNGFIDASETATADQTMPAGIVARIDPYKTVEKVEIVNCHNTGEIFAATANTSSTGGGVVGMIKGREIKEYVNPVLVRGCSHTGYVRAVHVDKDLTNNWMPSLGGIVGLVTADVEFVINGCSTGVAATDDTKYFDAAKTVIKGTVGDKTGTMTGGILGMISDSVVHQYEISDCVNYAPVQAGAELYEEQMNGAKNSAVGGILGFGYTSKSGVRLTIKNCVNYGDIYNYCQTENKENAPAGGIFGNLYTINVTVEDCVNYGYIETCYAGGIAGYTICTSLQLEGTHYFTNCVNYGNFSGTSYGGGIIGACGDSTAYPVKTVFTNCVNYGECVQGPMNREKTIAARVGGIIGMCSLMGGVEFNNCINFAPQTQGRFIVGGILGWMQGPGAVNVNGCVVTGNVKGTVARTGAHEAYGGLVGGINNASVVLTMKNNVVKGSVSGYRAGGFVGSAGAAAIDFASNIFMGPSITATNSGSASLFGLLSSEPQQGNNYSTVAVAKYATTSNVASTLKCTAVAMTDLTGTANGKGSVLNALSTMTEYTGCVESRDFPIDPATLDLFREYDSHLHDGTVYDLPFFDETNHWKGCRCWEADPSTVAPHQAEGDWEVYLPEESQIKHHYKKCSDPTCLYKVDEASCEYANFEQIGSTMHRMTCEICRDVSTEEHTFEWNQQSSASAGLHWLECFCHYIDESSRGVCAVGENGVVANCQVSAVCGTCVHHFGSPDTVNGHDFENGRYTSDLEQHWKVCANENCTAEDVQHKAYCDGGEATCEHKAMCDVCATSYGDAVDHTFGDWEIVKEATATEAGSKKRVCADCGETETALIAATANGGSNSDKEGLGKTAKIAIIAGAGVVAIVAILAVFLVVFMKPAPKAPVKKVKKETVEEAPVEEVVEEAPEAKAEEVTEEQAEEVVEEEQPNDQTEE